MGLCKCPCHRKSGRRLECGDGPHTAGLRRALDIVNGNADTRISERDLIAIVAQIVTDLYAFV